MLTCILSVQDIDKLLSARGIFLRRLKLFNRVDNFVSCRLKDILERIKFCFVPYHKIIINSMALCGPEPFSEVFSILPFSQQQISSTLLFKWLSPHPHSLSNFVWDFPLVFY
ncbi:hypothetical protein TNIN_192041 [Trichonephila inaurata madagascariensis]|uniref:Maturase K n=1 Tax=Trichonephila inaurata madagascariensis TaxID=2747483 RepID=A0A8X7BPM0_9ARAC|nr:hypothetical protein TNIN_192041 [Trichonephila inaurata madagascariensis]